MADIRPFRGVLYNKSLIQDLAAVICPPYDVISPRLREELYRKSQYNFVRIEFAPELPGDTPADNKYTRAAATLEQWLKTGVLKTDAQPAIYLHDHYFTYRGSKYRRRGIIVTVRLEEWSQMVVRPHENTLAAPKSDRLNLLRALRTNTSPVFGMFEDGGKKVASLLTSRAESEPVFDFSMNGEAHRLRAISQPGLVNQICGSLAGQPVYIADGHHRYESALNYRREKRAGAPAGPAEPFDFVMMTLVDFADPGLVILPAHRLVRGIPESTLGEMKPGLERFFEIETLSPDTPDTWQRAEDLIGGDNGGVRLMMFGPERGRLHVLTLRDLASASRMMPPLHSEPYRKLDVSIVDHVILEKVLGLADRDTERLAYTHERQDAVNRVLSREFQLAFLLRPVQAGMIKAVADAGDRMPRKSTYFYPKLPSGLVCYRLV